MPGLALTAATPWIVPTLPTAIPTQYPSHPSPLPGRPESVALGPANSTNKPDNPPFIRRRRSSNDVAVTRSWAPGSSGSRWRCRIGWCNVCRERRGCKCRAANAAATCAAELLARGLGGRQGGHCRGHVGLSVHPSSRERLLRDPRRPIQGRNASSVQAYLDANPQVGPPPGHQATRSRFLNRCGYANPLDNP